MEPIIVAISFFWFAVVLKYVLFWIYLWQLKEYHVGRFLDHFRTHKGKKIFLNVFYVAKFVTVIFFFTHRIFLYVVLLLYPIESLIFIGNILKGNFKKPVVTAKTAWLMLVSFFGVALCVFLIYTYTVTNTSFVFTLLLFDVAIPLFISVMVLLFQPFFVIARNSMLKKATQKRSTFKNLVVVGITGSYGKTSTKEFLTTILSQKFNVVSTKDHQNSEMGIAKCILNELTEKHEIFVVEMGSYKKGGIDLLCNMTKPNIGIVTGVNEQHLALFGSLKNLLSAEGGRELVDNLPKDGLLVVNGDNKYCLDLYKKTHIKKKIYTMHRDKIDSDVWAEEISVKEDSLDFMVINREHEAVHFNVSILGRQNIQNVLGAVLVARGLGMTLEEIAIACQNIKQEQAGITLKRGVHGITIIDSSYSSNPDGVMADLNYISVFKGKATSADGNSGKAGNSRVLTKGFGEPKKVIVMPCLIELGSKSKEIHYQIGKKIGQVCDLAVITTKDKFDDVKDGAMTTGMPENSILFCSNVQDIFTKITTFCKNGDAVLLEGRVPEELIRLLSKEKSA